MEKEVKKDKGIKIKLCVIIAGVLLILIGGYFTYKYLTNNNIASKFKLVTIEKTNEFGTKTKVLTINGKEVFTMYGDDEYEIIGYIDNMIVISEGGSIFIFDKDGNNISSFNNFPISDYSYEFNSKYVRKIEIEKNEIIMKYIVNEKNTEDILCNLVKDDEFYEEIDKVVYKDGKFGKKELVSKITNIEYREKNNIKCSNSIKVSMVEDDKKNEHYKFIRINDKDTEISGLYYILVGRIEDRIVIRPMHYFDLGNVYVFDKDGNYQVFGNFYIQSAKVENNSIVITSLLSDSGGVEEAICPRNVKDDDAFETVETITYKDGKFSSSKIVTMTVKDAYIGLNVDCSRYSKEDDSSTETEQTNIKKLDVDSKLVKDLYNDIRFDYTESCDAYLYYNSNKTTTSDLTNEQILTITAKKILQDKEKVTVTTQEYENTIKHLFGKDIKYEVKEINLENLFYTSINGNNITITSNAYGDLIFYKKIPYLYKAESVDDYIYIYEMPIFAGNLNNDTEVIFNSCSFHDEISKKEKNSASFDSILNDVKNDKSLQAKISKYKYTFKANGDGTYHFVEVEKMR